MNRFDGEPDRSMTDELADLRHEGPAFNTIGSYHGAQSAGPRRDTCPVAGDDPDAKRTAMLLVEV